MTPYSSAATLDELSILIDRAAAGERVLLKQANKPAVELRLVSEEALERPAKPEMYERLRRLRRSTPATGLNYLDLKRLDEADGLL